MHALKQVIPFAALLLLPACGPDSKAQESELATSASALSTIAISNGCTFTIAAQARPGVFPPIYDYVVTRQASGSCPFGASASTTVGSSYNSSSAITGNDLGIAVAYTVKNTASGSSPTSVYVKQIAPDTLSTVRSSMLTCGPSIYNVYFSNLFMPDGTTVQVDGTKGCTLYGLTESGSGSNYHAYYYNFFTTTNPPTVVAY